MTKEAVARRIWDRNSLRREAGLPLLPVKETFEREAARAEWRAIVDVHYDWVSSGILAERLKRDSDWGSSWGGSLALRLTMEKTLRERYLQR